jgi:hypothetical protein
MIDSDALIFVTLSLIILFLIHLLNSKRSIENFELTNDVPDKMKKELNYLKQVLKAKENEPFPPCRRSQRCSSNQRESWCYGKNDQDKKERKMKN